MIGNTNTYGIIGFEKNRPFIIFLLIWFVVNIIQSVFTEMMNDEAYYALYGDALAWGYYDHPPMVGLMTYLSGLLFNGNLSVRFATIIFQILTLIVTWKIIDERTPEASKTTLFAIITSSLVMFHAYGFVTAPDVPFLFFTALFIYSYKKFIEENSWSAVLLLSISMSGMFYSKYHAVLVIGFIVLSNLRLLCNYKFWLSGIIALLFLTPHIYWQFANDFPSFKYHLSDRSSNFRWNYFFEYLPNQLAVFNPFTFGAVIYITIKYKWRDIFERSLYFMIIGFIVFFWITSCRGHVEPHWTVAASIPMIILLYRRSLDDKKLTRYVKHWIAPSIILILIARIALIAGLFPQRLNFSGKEERNLAIESVAGDTPVVFTGSFQNPSNYSFFTKKESTVLSAIDSRQTQFDIWAKELNYQGKKVFICSKDENRSKEYIVDGHTFYGYFTDNFQSVNRVKIDYTLDAAEAAPGTVLRIPFEMYNPTDKAVDFNHLEFAVSCKAAYMTNRQLHYADCRFDTPVGSIPANGAIKGELTTIVPDIKPDGYTFTLTLVNPVCSARNSNYQSINISSK